MATLSFYNDRLYIRVENSATQVTSYFLKANLTFQADADTSFFLKSDTLQTYYLYDDVVRPLSTSIKNLMEIFQSWIEDTNKDQELKPLITESTSTVLEVKTFYDKDPLRVAELLAGSATTTFEAGKNAVRMSITDGVASRAVRQTKPYAAIINNKIMYSIVSATLLTDTTARNVVSRAGCYDDNTDITVTDAVASGNGVFFQWKAGEGLSLTLRSNISGAQVDEVVLQNQWNIDTLDTFGPTGLQMNADVENTFIFEWSALKGNVIRAGYMQGGFPVFCHKFSNVRMGCASVPLRWEITRADPTLPAADNDAANMIQGCGSVMIQGANEFPTVTRSKTILDVRNVTHANSPQPILSMRLRPSTNRARVQPRRLRILNLDKGFGKWSLVLNPSTLTNAAFADIGAGSYAQFSEAENAVSGGVVLASGFLADAGVQTVDLDDKALLMCADIAGNPDTLTLVVHYMRGVVTLSASVEWAEME